MRKPNNPVGILWISLDNQESPVVSRLPVRASHYHVTLKFGCKLSAVSQFIGNKVRVSIDSDCYNERIQALSVSLPSEVLSLCQNRHPHVTISMDEGVKPVESNEMLSSDHFFSSPSLTQVEGTIEFTSF
jgi:hypothetical protein